MSDEVDVEGCYFCTEERLEKHHIVPRRFDGSDDAQNIVSVCPTCHSKLERLYNKRFYDALGVSVEAAVSGPCDHSECTAAAETDFNTPDGWESLQVCDGHATCGYCEVKRVGGAVCDRQASIAAVPLSDTGEITLRCTRHANCHHDGCRAAGQLAVNKGPVVRTYCLRHAHNEVDQ